MAKTPRNGEDSGDASANPQRPLCGIVMPISAMDGYPEAHWAEVLGIIRDVAETAGFEANLVSSADDVGIIQKRIIQNLYDNPIVVCDVSGRNPNVMFELGLRLAFDKPAIIIKDDKTTYAFDTAPIEHLGYPHDLRYNSIVAFKETLAEKISATHKRANNDPSYTTFLKHFGEFKIASVDVKEGSSEEIMIEEIRELKSMLRDFWIGVRTRSQKNVPKQSVSFVVGGGAGNVNKVIQLINKRGIYVKDVEIHGTDAKVVVYAPENMSLEGTMRQIHSVLSEDGMFIQKEDPA
jgi:hypothetical protein